MMVHNASVISLTVHTLLFRGTRYESAIVIRIKMLHNRQERYNVYLQRLYDLSLRGMIYVGVIATIQSACYTIEWQYNIISLLATYRAHCLIIQHLSHSNIVLRLHNIFPTL